MSKGDRIKKTRRAISDALGNWLSSTCIVRRDNEWLVQGKFCVISQHDNGTWDIYICDPEDARRGLNQRSVINRVNSLKTYAVKGSVQMSAGEAWLTVPSLDFLEQHARLCRVLGIKRKKRLTETQKAALLERFSSGRERNAA